MKIKLEKQKRIIIIIYAIIFILIGMSIRHNPAGTDIDRFFYNLLAPIIKDGRFIEISKIFAFIGSVKFILPLMLILISIKLKQKSLADAFKLLSGSLIVYIINEIIKHIYLRPRPINMRVAQGGLSFPSGHAMVSICLYLTIADIYFKDDKNIKAKIFAIVFSILMAISRIILYVHYPTDVLAGLIMGYIIYTVIFGIKFKNKLK